MALEDIKGLIANEAEGFARVQQLRDEFSPALFSKVRNVSREEAVAQGLRGVQDVLQAYENLGISLRNISPGHGAGHISRDYLNAYVLLNELHIDPKHAFIGFITGCLHDIGCALVHRYSETTRAVRHAEAGALLFLNTDTPFLNPAEKTLIAWGVAAHTYYFKTDNITCSDGVTRQMGPYQDLDDLENPLYGIWLARWIDRLDCNGPTFPGRHYLTIGEPHMDFTDGAHHVVEFADHLTPILRTPEQIKLAGGKRTMLDHLQGFVRNHANSSPYGKYDTPEYARLRDSYKPRMQRVIDAVVHPEMFSEERRSEILAAWNDYLRNNIEPSPVTESNITILTEKFNGLDEATRNAWCSGFLTCMKEYREWADERLDDLKELRPEYNSLPGISDDLRAKVLSPAFDLNFLS